MAMGLNTSGQLGQSSPSPTGAPLTLFTQLPVVPLRRCASLVLLALPRPHPPRHRQHQDGQQGNPRPTPFRFRGQDYQGGACRPLHPLRTVLRNNPRAGEG